MTSIPVAKRGDHRLRQSLRIARGLAFAMVILFAAIYAPLKHHLRAASVLWGLQNPASESWIVRKVAQIGLNPVRTETRTIPASKPIVARFYYPVGYDKAPAVIVLHGVHHLGIEEPRLVAFAKALSSHGFQAITPELNDLADYRVTLETIQTIGECAHFVRQSSGKPATIIGLSFAGGLALMAAAEPQWRDDIGLIVAVGGYDDLQRVLEYYATNLITDPSGKVTKLPAHEYGPLICVYDYPGEFFSARDVAAARTTLRYLLWEDRNRAQTEAKQLTSQGEQRMEALFQHHIDGLSPVLLRGIRKYHDQLAAISPHGHLAGLQAAIYLLHGAADNIVPASETEWLERDVPSRSLRMALISPVLSHLDLDRSPTLADKLKLVHFMSDFLRDADSSGAALPIKSPSPRSQLRIEIGPSTWSH
jgi:pimeloyl-ACP methyl ester carboxylesterase